MRAAVPKRSRSADSVLAGVEESKLYSWQEISCHDGPDDCWMVIKHKVCAVCVSMSVQLSLFALCRLARSPLLTRQDRLVVDHVASSRSALVT